MMNRYKLLHFLPDPHRPDSLAVGAILESNGDYQLIIPGHNPGGKCLRSPHAERLLQIALESAQSLDPIELFHHSRNPLGPLFRLDEQPTQFEHPHPQSFIRDFVFGRRFERKKTRTSTHRRSTDGWRFLKMNSMGSSVRKEFRAESVFPKKQFLPNVSLYVENPERGFLLMEPLNGSRRKFESDLRKALNILSVWHAKRDSGDHAMLSKIELAIFGYYLEDSQADEMNDAFSFLEHRYNADKADDRDELHEVIKQAA